jgi:putative sigma-54 modulation protein
VEIEIFKEPNPRVADCHVAEATLYLKGVTLRARDRSPEMLHSLNLMLDELARQVKRHRDKRRHRREARVAAANRRSAAEAAAQMFGQPTSQPASQPGL